MMDTMSDYSFYQVLNNLVLNAENKDSNKQFITDFNDNKDFLELKLNNYPIESIESSFIKSYIYPIIVSGLIFLFSSFFIFINGMMIRNLRKYSIYLSWGAQIRELIIAMLVPFLVVLFSSLLMIFIMVDFVHFSPLKPNFVIEVYSILIIIFTLLCTIVINSSTVKEFYR